MGWLLRLDKNKYLVPVAWPTCAQPTLIANSLHFWELPQENLKSVCSDFTIVNIDRKFDLFHLTPHSLSQSETPLQAITTPVQ